MLSDGEGERVYGRRRRRVRKNGCIKCGRLENSNNKKKGEKERERERWKEIRRGWVYEEWKKGKAKSKEK